MTLSEVTNESHLVGGSLYLCHTECAVLLQMNSHGDTEMNMSMAETFAEDREALNGVVGEVRIEGVVGDVRIEVHCQEF